MAFSISFYCVSSREDVRHNEYKLYVESCVCSINFNFIYGRIDNFISTTHRNKEKSV